MVRGETFDADQDQRHAINVSGTVALPRSTSVGVTFRGGTNFPIPGCVAAHDGRLFASDRRNQVRLPAYARLDLRGERAFRYRGRRFVLFAETLNVLNRANVGLAGGRILPVSQEAVGLTTRLFPRIATAGLRFEF